jgi:hypothetical protein
MISFVQDVTRHEEHVLLQGLVWSQGGHGLLTMHNNGVALPVRSNAKNAFQFKL